MADKLLGDELWQMNLMAVQWNFSSREVSGSLLNIEELWTVVLRKECKCRGTHKERSQHLCLHDSTGSTG